MMWMTVIESVLAVTWVDRGMMEHSTAPLCLLILVIANATTLVPGHLSVDSRTMTLGSDGFVDVSQE